MPSTIYNLFKDCSVEAKNLQDFLDRYYRKDRHNLYTAGHALKEGREDLKEHGITWISKFESITGKVVAFIAE